MLWMLTLTVLAAFLTISWWLGRAFWKRSQLDGLSYRAWWGQFIQLLMLSVAFFLVVYVFTAAFMLPWAQGMCKACYSASEKTWRQAHLLHDGLLLGLTGLSAVVAARQHSRGGAALCWLASCLLVVGGFWSLRHL